MSAHATRAALAATPVPTQQKTRGFLRIVRHGGGPAAIYIVTYHRLNEQGVLPKPAMAEGAEALIDLLERIGVDFRVSEVRGALEDILRFGSANIPDLWLSDEEMVEKGLVES
jgi:predicted ThiF/HesA family dinucleotide-utilizing enzyme